MSKSSEKVRRCYLRAAEAHDRAARAKDASVRTLWFKIEDRWIRPGAELCNDRSIGRLRRRGPQGRNA